MKTYRTIDRLSDKAQDRFSSVGSGGMILNGIMLISAALSALFFWQNSHLIFQNVYPPLALLLGLLAGLVPAEGAFFGWTIERARKKDMTTSQLKASKYGIVASVIFAIFSTFALYVINFTYVPDDIAQYDTWLVFLALSLPVMVQVAIIAAYKINERVVVKNFETAKLTAMGFDAYIKAEQARIEAIIEGMEQELDQRLTDYGKQVGAQEAGGLLDEGVQNLLNMGNARHRADTMSADDLEAFSAALKDRSANGRNRPT